MMFYPEIKAFATRLEKRSGKAMARTVVAKELAEIVYLGIWDQSERLQTDAVDCPRSRMFSRWLVELPIDLAKEPEQSRCHGNDGGEDNSLDSDLL